MSNLITHGLGGTLITHGMGGTSVIIPPEPPLVSQPSGGGILIPKETIAKGEFKLEIIHLEVVKQLLPIISNHVSILSRLPIIVRRALLELQTSVDILTITSTIQGLTLNIRTAGVELHED